MPDNYLRKSLLLFTLVVAVLLAFSWLPPFTIGSWKFKRVNLLADITREPVQPVAASDSTKANKKKPVIPENACPAGITCIEDFGEHTRALGKFFSSLKGTSRRSVRIAFFGDSFIEGDIFCGPFRDTLQHLFGGRGIGFVPITSEVAAYRTTIQHTFGNWKTYSIVGAKNVFSPPGTSGYCFVPLDGNEVEYRPGRWRSTGARFHTIQVYYRSPMAGVLQYVVNDTSSFSTEFSSSDSLQELTLPKQNATSVKFRFTSFDSLKLYGVAFESNPGIYVDNFAMRGNSGIGLYQIDPRHQREFNRFRDYRLVILQYGLNVVSENDSTGYAWYVDRMTRVIRRLQESFPASSFLLIGVSDRSSNQDGKFSTMPNIVLMRDAQREIAEHCHIAFWDLYAAMGGKNSMPGFVNAVPPLAAKDYTHLNFAGGKKLAKKLADALLYERTRYDKTSKR